MKPKADPGFNAALLVALEELRKTDRLEAEIAQILSEKGFEEPEIGETLERLKAWRFLDDRRTVDSRVSQLRRRRIGRARIAHQLLERGAPEQEVTDRLGEFTDDSEIDLAVELLRAKRKDSPAQAARFLAYRGFDEETIEAAVNRVFADQEFPR